MRAAFVVIAATAVGLLGLLSFRAQTFGGFVGQNNPLRTVPLGPQAGTVGSSAGSTTVQSRAGSLATRRSSRSTPRVAPRTGTGTTTATGTTTGTTRATGTRVRRCRVVINGQTLVVNTRDGRDAVVSLPGGG